MRIAPCASWSSAVRRAGPAGLATPCAARTPLARSQHDGNGEAAAAASDADEGSCLNASATAPWRAKTPYSPCSSGTGPRAAAAAAGGDVGAAGELGAYMKILGVNLQIFGSILLITIRIRGLYETI
jgi:hypothetical protein